MCCSNLRLIVCKNTDGFDWEIIGVKTSQTHIISTDTYAKITKYISLTDCNYDEIASILNMFQHTESSTRTLASVLTDNGMKNLNLSELGLIYRMYSNKEYPLSKEELLRTFKNRSVAQIIYFLQNIGQPNRYSDLLNYLSRDININGNIIYEFKELLSLSDMTKLGVTGKTQSATANATPNLPFSVRAALSSATMGVDANRGVSFEGGPAASAAECDHVVDTVLSGPGAP